MERAHKSGQTQHASSIVASVSSPFDIADRVAVSELCSEYLLDGWRNENIHIHSILHQPRTSIAALLSVTKYVLPSDGVFHLSALQAFVWLQQLGVIYGALERNTTKAELGEVYLRRCTWKFVRPIGKTENISIRIDVRRTRDMPFGTVSEGDFDFEHGCMTGSLAAIIPFPA